MNNKISVFIITFNEEKIIAKCLEKLSWADEIVVVDSGSTDKTVEICKQFNAKVIYNKFENFGIQKQFALQQTKNQWVLSLDADEVLSDKLILEIQNLKFSNDIKAYQIKRNHVFMNKIFKYGNESNRLILRLFNKSFGKFTQQEVHEYIEIEGKIARLHNPFMHFSYPTINLYINKLNLYTSFYANNQVKVRRFSNIKIILKINFEFVKQYFLNKNFLNGKEGFYWSVLCSFYMFTKCLKTNELYQSKFKISL
jgi:glycosyltransferase involved in cell wall biosynthesis